MPPRALHVSEWSKMLETLATENWSPPDCLPLFFLSLLNITLKQQLSWRPHFPLCDPTIVEVANTQVPLFFLQIVELAQTLWQTYRILDPVWQCWVTCEHLWVIWSNISMVSLCLCILEDSVWRICTRICLTQNINSTLDMWLPTLLQKLYSSRMTSQTVRSTPFATPTSSVETARQTPLVE